VAQNASDIVGLWYNAEKSAKIEIYKKGEKYFGKIVWLSEPLRDGKPKLDHKNENEKLRTRPVLGLHIFENFEFDEDEWDGGTIYDPKNGKTYSCVITKEGEVLEVTGYIGLSFIGRTTQWTRAK
jgi:uncharacterized protein (DUF2147 family)